MQLGEFYDASRSFKPNGLQNFQLPEHGYLGRAHGKCGDFLFVLNVVNNNSFTDAISRLNQKHNQYIVFDVVGRIE